MHLWENGRGRKHEKDIRGDFREFLEQDSAEEGAHGNRRTERNECARDKEEIIGYSYRKTSSASKCSKLLV